MSFDSDVIEAFLFYLDNEMPYSLRVYLVVELKEAHIKLHVAKPVKLDLNKKFRKTRNENSPSWEIGVTS